MEDFDRSVDFTEFDSQPDAEPETLPLPSISEQFKVIQSLFPKKTSDEREAFSGYRRLIHSFPAVEENVIATRLMDRTEELDLFAASDLNERMRLNRVIIITGARFLMESLDAKTPGDLHFGRTIYGQFLDNLEQVGLPKERARRLISKEDLYDAWNNYIEEKDLPPVLLADAKLAEDKVEQVLDIDTSRDAPQCANS